MPYHVPVLAAEILTLVGHPRRVVDATLGDGGHAERFLEAGAEVLGIDRDPEAIARARARLGVDSRLRCVLGNAFDPAIIARIAEFAPDLILLDLGVSSPQLDRAERGFTFRPGAPLDMRMGAAGSTAADLLNTALQTELARWFREYADERRAARLAKEIVRRRAVRPFTKSDDLVNAIRAGLGSGAGPADFARLFQAVRVAVNDELGALGRALPELRDALVDGGVLAVISYHSGEDRIVKHALREWSRACVCPPQLPVCRCRGRPLGRLVAPRAITPRPAEIAANPRARSARLRAFRLTRDGAEA